jgi:hypothetical protein
MRMISRSPRRVVAAAVQVRASWAAIDGAGDVEALIRLRRLDIQRDHVGLVLMALEPFGVDQRWGCGGDCRVRQERKGRKDEGAKRLRHGWLARTGLRMAKVAVARRCCPSLGINLAGCATKPQRPAFSERRSCWMASVCVGAVMQDSISAGSNDGSLRLRSRAWYWSPSRP